MTGRSVDEWIGKTPDAKIPPRVRARIFERENGICHISGRKIQPGEKWEADHKVALVNGGEHREGNLYPALVDKHKEKTRADVAEKADIARVKAKHIGVIGPKATIANRGFQRTSTKRVAHPMSMPPRRDIFTGRVVS